MRPGISAWRSAGSTASPNVNAVDFPAERVQRRLRTEISHHGTMSASDPVATHRPSSGSSDRTFGFIFAVVFGFMGVWPILSGGRLRIWALVLAVVFLAAGLLAPPLLAPLNRIWTRLGLLLHHVVNPIIMALVYYVAVVPMGILLRARGKDLLRLRRDRDVASYWIIRDPPGPPADSMIRQF